MMSYLSPAGVLIKDFMGYAEKVTKRLRQTTEENAQAAGRQVRYLPGATRKDELVEKIRREEGLAADGLIVVLSTLENCYSYDIYRNRSAKRGTVLRVETTINDVRGLKVFRHRALNHLVPTDAQLLAAVARGEFHITGFRNRDVHRILFGQAASDQQRHRQASRVTRQLVLLRAHGLIRKVPTSHRYLLSVVGQVAILALLAGPPGQREGLASGL